MQLKIQKATLDKRKLLQKFNSILLNKLKNGVDCVTSVVWILRYYSSLHAFLFLLLVP